MPTYTVDVDVTYRSEFQIEARNEESARKKALKLAPIESQSAPTVLLDIAVVGVEET